ncbi:MAG: transglutaminase family protein [Deltaproteobacteria bacterium]|nr:transglutaminase family protein [Deltaproteobacteria bacterium]
MRILVQHSSHYHYPAPAALGPHVIRLRPTDHTRTRVESYRLAIEQEHRLHWQRDPHGNHVARVSFRAGQKVTSLDLMVELALDVQPINPFDFFVDDRAKVMPFAYPDRQSDELAPFLDRTDPAYQVGAAAKAFFAGLPSEGNTIDTIVAINAAIAKHVRYVIRDEAGVWTPEETLGHGRGSCRDSAVLLVAAARSRGIAARFVSGYLLQLTDEGMLPDEPRGVDRDVVDLHAWAEVYVPGAGWIGLDATSGLMCGEGHIPLACTATPSSAAPLDGTSDIGATSVSFTTRVARLGHEPRPTAPYPEPVWQELLTAADRADAALIAAGVRLTLGGEPTFTSRFEPALPEWNGAALGASKWTRGQVLADELRARLAPGAALIYRMGKHYPGESLPRWAIDLVSRRDGVPLWAPDRGDGDAQAEAITLAHAEALIHTIAARLGVPATAQAAYEDPWRLIQDEAQLPLGIDPKTATLDDPEERRRLARVLDRGATAPAGWVLPLARNLHDDAWLTERWSTRREAMFLIPGDSPMGLRLPLGALGPGLPPPWPVEEPSERDPRRVYDEDDGKSAGDTVRDADVRRIRLAAAQGLVQPGGWTPPLAIGIRTALCVELRADELWVFLPPVASQPQFIALIDAIAAAARDLGVAVRLEGYAPPPGALLAKFAITPDPGVIEVNLAPTATGRDYAELVGTVFDAALAAGLIAEKHLLDGRLAGSGGGNHLTLGGPTPLASPFLQRPDLLASLITFVQHHPSLSYLFTGLFVGPTSQAPRVDEARHDALYELEIALDRARAQPTPAPWLVDALFRNLLVDVAGSTHRAELSLDKLYDPQTPYGRQGLVEMRAYEMPPHPRMTAAQGILARALVAAFVAEPYAAPLVRWGQELHDRFLLPYWMWRDFEDVLALLADRGVALPAEAYRPFVELRCPLIGRLAIGDVVVELRNAIEPWHVLGEEVTAAGTARYVDSSMERIEVRVSGHVPERHVIAVGGAVLPLRQVGERGLAVGGVRFRAWAPPHALHPHLGIHHPVRIDLIDIWARRSLGACAYHVWHPEGRGYETPPLTRAEASARRAQRFTFEGPMPMPVALRRVAPHPDQPHTLDLRRLSMDRPMPRPEDWLEPEADR